MFYFWAIVYFLASFFSFTHIICTELQQKNEELDARLKQTCKELELTKKENERLKQMYDELQKELMIL